MQKSFKITLTCAIAFMFTLAFSLDAAAFNGRVTVGQAEGAPGEVVGVPVYLGGNDTAFTGFRIPLRYSSADLTPDSVSLVGSIVDPRMIPVPSMDPDSQYFGLTVLPPFDANVPSVSVDSGLLATFWFTVSPSAGSQAIIIDSLNTVDTVFIPTITFILRRLEFVPLTDSIAYPVTPEFIPGQVLILSTGVEDDDDAIVPNSYELSQNYPNPFNPTTTIKFALPSSGEVSLRVFNVLGQVVETIHSGTLAAGDHTIQWDALGYPSGIYFYRLSSKHGVMTRKMTLLK